MRSIKRVVLSVIAFALTRRDAMIPILSCGTLPLSRMSLCVGEIDYVKRRPNNNKLRFYVSRSGVFSRDGANDIAPTWQSWTCMLDVQMQFNSMGYAGPGHFIMPDMLEVGNGMTNDEDQSHFSLWAMIAAPLVTKKRDYY